MNLFLKYILVFSFSILLWGPVKANPSDKLYEKLDLFSDVLNTLKKEEELKINNFKLNDDNFKNEEKKILSKRNLISEDEINKELKLLQVKFQKYRKEKIKEFDEFKIKRNRNIKNFLNLINPIIEKYMADNSIYMLIDKKNVFIAKKEFDITKNLIELIDNQIKTIEIE